MTLDEFLVKLKATRGMPWEIRYDGLIRCGMGCPITVVATGNSITSAGWAGNYAIKLSLDVMLTNYIVGAADWRHSSFNGLDTGRLAEIRRKMLEVLGLEERNPQ